MGVTSIRAVADGATKMRRLTRINTNIAAQNKTVGHKMQRNMIDIAFVKGGILFIDFC